MNRGRNFQWYVKSLQSAFLLTGFLSLLWFLLRVIPKPSRAAYPCMRATAPMASGFILWIIGVGASGVAFKTAHRSYRKSKTAVTILCAAIAMSAAIWAFLGYDRLPLAAYFNDAVSYEIASDPVNDPIGVAKGHYPGRVVWVHDAGATNWLGPASGQSCWDLESTDQRVVDHMISRAVRWLSGENTDAEAWDVLLRYFNRKRGKGDRVYQSGEKIAIKLNLTTSNASYSSNKSSREKTSHLDKAGDTTPQFVLALLRQLIYVVGVRETDISVGDPVAFFTDPWYNLMASEFPDVNYLDHYAYPGRTQVQHSTNPFYWSTTDAGGKLVDYLPVSFAEADYLINLAVLKGHSAGITACAKNHYGSLIRNPVGREWGRQRNYYNLHDSLPNSAWSPGRGQYRALVDLMGHHELGAKTLLYLIDGLYGGYYWEGRSFKWNMPPFNGNWPSSLFASQDPVAIDSVAYDFLLTEWPHVVENGTGGPGSLLGGAQDYLHEAALADNPPSATVYDPENDSIAMSSLGVHEHWNNSTDKQYSRNLETGEGIELISNELHLPACDGDFDDDTDIDAEDLIDLAFDISQLSPAEFARNFGTVDCYR